ncbi:hypothetical protein KP79_PYT20893 [Mizuhopecten yessoensis]|uniref:Uncharacterized protein n=1 Tax=Mizuhopecten yessoensis TaxID=6573 RepID=A0A210Q4C5_MIZYE|nr:hypothetical protein KP79_PYT20893 [Mizuhopecten yessoensis]
MRYPGETATETFLLHDWCNFMFQTKRVNLDAMPNIDVFIKAVDVNYDEEENKGLENSVFDQHLSGSLQRKTQCNLKKKHVKSIHKPMDLTLCENRRVFKYHCHKEIHPKTRRVVTYKSESRESKAAHTISSFVCMESSTSTKVTQKLRPRVYVNFGRVKHFIEHVGGNSASVSFASVMWFDNVSYDTESALWFVEKKCTYNKTTSLYVKTKSLSSPLVTAEDDNHLWFLNSGKKVE